MGTITSIFIFSIFIFIIFQTLRRIFSFKCKYTFDSCTGVFYDSSAIGLNRNFKNPGSDRNYVKIPSSVTGITLVTQVLQVYIFGESCIASSDDIVDSSRECVDTPSSSASNFPHNLV